MILALTSLALATDDATIERLLNSTDDVARGDSSVAVMVMEVKTERYERTVKMKAWSQGTDKSLVVILEPAKEKGVATLMVEDNIWNYLPKVDRTMKVPAAMMSGSWMGSHVTNDDLVKGSRMSEDYTWELTADPANGDTNYVIELTPRPDAPVVYGKVIVTVTPDELPVSTTFHDEDGTLVRTMEYKDVKTVDGKEMPTTFLIVPANKDGEYTKMTYESLDFDVDIPADTFSLKSLKQ